MRTSCILLATLLLLGVATGEENPCLKKVFTLHEKTKDASASWDERYKAYKQAKEAMKEKADAMKRAKAALRDGDETTQAAYADAEAASENCEAAYETILPEVADGLRRDAVPASGWVMGLFGAALLWGGFSVCCIIAMRSGRSGTEED